MCILHGQLNAPVFLRFWYCCLLFYFLKILIETNLFLDACLPGLPCPYAGVFGVFAHSAEILNPETRTHRVCVRDF